MGNNAAFTSFEASVIATYNRGVLDKELLADLAKPYADTDIDRGGMKGTLTKDGLDIDGVILKMHGVELPPFPDLPKDFKEWTPEQYNANDEWVELEAEAVQKIETTWGW